MALINCPDCKKEVSSKASSCLHCGFPMQEAAIKCPECETKLTSKAKTCQKCGYPIRKSSNNIAGEEKEFTEFEQEENSTYESEENNIEGLGGWLVFIGILVIVYPLSIVFKKLPFYYKIFTDGTWEALTTAGLQSYNSLWSPVILGELLFYIGFLIASIFIVFQFFSKKKTFPKWFIGILLFRLLYNFIDYLALKAILPKSIVDVSEHISLLIIITVVIWYIIVSERVKATFIN